MMIITRKSLGSWALTATLATLTVAGCGGGGSSTPASTDSFCDQKAQKECQVSSKCGTVNSACLMQRKSKCLAFAAAALTDPMRQFTAGNVSACVNKTNSVYALQMIRQADLDDMNDVCSYVFQGTSTGVCTTKYDCAGKKICDTKSNGPLCATSVNKNKGDPCGNAGEVCTAGAYCAQDPTRANAYYCLPKGMAGAACDAATPCLENSLHCDATSHLCAPRVNANEACVTSDDCPMAAPYCDPYVGSKCDVGLIFAPTAAAACADYGGTAPAPGTGGSSGAGSGGSTGTNDASSSG